MLLKRDGRIERGHEYEEQFDWWNRGRSLHGGPHRQCHRRRSNEGTGGAGGRGAAGTTGFAGLRGGGSFGRLSLSR